MVRIGPLTDEQRQMLERVRRRAVGRVSQRAPMVLLSARGYTVEQIAEIFGVGEDVVRQWLHRYEREGPLGLDDRPRPGRPPKERLARHIVDAQTSNPPCTNGLVQGGWTVGLLTAFLATRFRLVLSPASVRRYLHQAGWRWVRPRLAPATHAPRGQRKEDPAAPLKLALLAQAIASTATLRYLDESDLHLLPVIRACWMQGPRLRVPTPGQNAKRALFGALNARTGQLHHLVRPRKRAIQFVEFLDTLAAAYPTGEVILALDNVITHDAKLVRAWLARPEHARFRFRWLPKYSAHEHNPIERVWGQELPAGAIAKRFAVTRPAISQHLTVLKEAGLIAERREGTRRLYRARQDRLAEMLSFLQTFWDESLAALKLAAEAEAREERGVTSKRDDVVEREIRIAAPPETVWQYFVDPERLARWIGTARSLDLRPGGEMSLLVAGQHVSRGTFLEIDPPRRMVYTMGWDEPNHPIPPGSTRVEIDLTPDGDGTLLQFRHLGLPADAIDDHNAGWKLYLDRLAIAATGGDPGPDPNAAH